MANCESYLFGSVQIWTTCFLESRGSFPACALPCRHAWRWHLCQSKIRGNASYTECVLDWRTTDLHSRVSHKNKILETDLRTIFWGCNIMPEVRKSTQWTPEVPWQTRGRLFGTSKTFDRTDISGTFRKRSWDVTKFQDLHGDLEISLELGKHSSFQSGSVK